MESNHQIENIFWLIIILILLFLCGYLYFRKYQIIKGTVGAAGILINVLWIFIFQAIAALAMRIRRNA